MIEVEADVLLVFLLFFFEVRDPRGFLTLLSCCAIAAGVDNGIGKDPAGADEVG